MVLGLLSAIAATPAIIGTTEAVKHGQNANARERHRGQKVNLRVRLPRLNAYSAKFDGSLVVLKDNKLYIQHADSAFHPSSIHPFLGYYLPYPSNQDKWKTAGWKGEGLVSTINEDNMLNWVYVDAQTYEVKYGVRAEAEANLVGPWDCTNIDKRMTFEGWEGFVAVQEDEGRNLWALYFDRGDDGLSAEGLIGDTGVGVGVERRQVRMLEVQLMRTEKEKTKEMAVEERVERLRAMAGKAKEEQERAVHGEGQGDGEGS